MADPEEDQQSDDRKTAKNQGCPVEMHDGRPCGRPIYKGPPGVDKVPVCLMHSQDHNKDDAAFQAEFEHILQEAGDGVADFTRFVFPSSNYGDRGYKARCVFANAIFTRRADFEATMFERGCEFAAANFVEHAIFFQAIFKQATSFRGANFMQGADFREATFAQTASFRKATFTDGADFDSATFTQDADFREATFTQDADFHWARFMQVAEFSGAKFKQDADFSGARFTQRADFSGATFTQAAHFLMATFTRDAYFRRATFTEDATFLRATFKQGADFSDATFTHAADFWEATFTQDANFSYAKFKQGAIFNGARFLEAALFRETRFREDSERVPGPVFSLAEFKKPDAVIFYKTYLGQALFHNCDVSNFVFSTVRWRRRSNGKSMVFDEDVDFSHHAPSALKREQNSADERNYSLIAELYQQLKKNYDDRRDYWTAGDFHYGEMEMKRLACPRLTWLSWLQATLSSKPRLKRVGDWCGKLQSNPWLLGKVRWWHQHFGLAAWYRRASDYGESWGKPLLWLVAVLLVFSTVYPAVGLRSAMSKSQAIQANVAQSQTQTAPSANLTYWNSSQRARLFGNSLMTSLGVAAFQRDLTYEPTYPWGRLLALLELLLTSTLIALFLLAVRRQFRR